MQCLRMVSFAWATYNKCLRTADCNLVCSLEPESHTALFLLSIHSPDNVFLVLASIFISIHNRFCLAAACNHGFMTYWNIEHNMLKTYVQSYNTISMSRHSDANTITIPHWDISRTVPDRSQGSCFHCYSAAASCCQFLGSTSFKITHGS